MRAPDVPITAPYITAPIFAPTDDEDVSDAPPKVSPLRAFGTPRPQFDRHAPFEGRVDTRRRRKLKAVARELPREPGVYFFYGENDRLLYIGKAKCLRERVGSYFGETTLRRPPKLRRLLAEIKRLEYEVYGSELEALLVERRLIAERLPILNRQHKRFAVYPYLLLTDEEFPRLTLTRAEPAEGEAEEPSDNFPFGYNTSSALPLETPPRAGEVPGIYLGPFTSPRSAFWTFEAVRTLFPLRSCEGHIEPDARGRGCFYHEIKRCAGPCIGASSTSDYSKLCGDLVSLLQTGEAPQIEALRGRMMRLAEEWRFEEAAQVKEQLAAIEAITARLQRLHRMRSTNNVVIVQSARSDSGRSACVFLVQGSVLRRRIVVTDWERDQKALRDAIDEVYGSPPPVAAFTAKTELDEMMILDRWLRSNGEQPCCLWMNEKSSRQWASNAVRGVQRWMNTSLAAC